MGVFECLRYPPWVKARIEWMPEFVPGNPRFKGSTLIPRLLRICRALGGQSLQVDALVDAALHPRPGIERVESVALA
jgi:hypothetical protein